MTNQQEKRCEECVWRYKKRHRCLAAGTAFWCEVERSHIEGLCGPTGKLWKKKDQPK